MKRIALALFATIVTLGTLAQGTLQKRLQGNPKIDSLMSDVAARGGSPQVYYYYDGKLHKTVSISCWLKNDIHSTLPTGDPRMDARNHMIDSVRMEQSRQAVQIYNAIRSTCKALTDDAKESYAWEYHCGGVDSVRYAIALGEYQSGDTMTTWQHEREVEYYDAPEIITFRYDPWTNNDGEPWTPKGLAYFRYEYTPDSVSTKTRDYVPFNKKAYEARLQPILKQEGITTRQFYVYCDSTFSFKDMKWNDDDDFVVHVKTLSPLQPTSETRGTVYTMQSKALADSVLSQLIQATWAFLEDNQGINFHFHPLTTYSTRTLNEIFGNLDFKRLMGFYHIYLHSIGDKEFNIVLLEGTGEMMVPMEWLIVKSWKNGKVVYDKKRLKALTPQQARNNTSAHRFTQTREYEPVD